MDEDLDKIVDRLEERLLDLHAKAHVKEQPFTSGAPVLGATEAGASAHAAYDGADEEVVTAIKDLLDTRVRPAVAQDGGDIVFHGYRDGTVFLHMRGACAGCPSATLTLKNGIENLLRHYIPEVQLVEAVQ